MLFGHCEEDLTAPYSSSLRRSPGLPGPMTWSDPSWTATASGSASSRPGRPSPRAPPAAWPRQRKLDTDCSPRSSTSLARLAEDRPLVLAFDDVQWADPSSLQLLCHLIGSRQAGPCSCRGLPEHDRALRIR